MKRPNLEDLHKLARRDDWHTALLGSDLDIRQVISYALALERSQWGEYRYNWQGQDFRVVIADDVVSIPGWAGNPGWSMSGFGAGPMSIEWLMSEGGLPGPKARKLALAEMIRLSLKAHHARGTGGDGDGDAVPMGPFMPCPACTGSGARMRGFVLATPEYRGQVLTQEKR